MSYLPDLSTRERRTELFPPPLFTPPTTVRTRAISDAWAADTFWYSVFFLGCMAAALVLWGAYSVLPRSGNSEKSLRAEHAVPKLKGEVPTVEPRWAEPVQVALQPPPPPPPLADGPPVMRFDALPPTPKRVEPLSAPIRIEPPAPMKAERPMQLVEFPAPPLSARVDLPMSVPPVVPQEVVVPVLPEPTIFLSRGNPGETPMIRTWKTLALYSLIAVTPVTLPAPASAGGQDTAKVEKQVEDLKKQFDDLRGLFGAAIKTIDSAGKGIDSLRTDIGKLQEDVSGLKATKLTLDIELGRTNSKIDNLEKQLGNLQADISFLRRELTRQPSAASAPTDKSNVDELKKHLVAIEQAILKLHATEPNTSNRIALSPPSPTARVLLVNMYHEEMLFIVNQKAFRVAPRSVMPLESVPAGSVSYEVVSPTWGLRDQKTRTLSANETLSLTVQ